MTARKGQGKTLISWDDARTTLNSWVGYKIMVVEGESGSMVLSDKARKSV